MLLTLACSAAEMQQATKGIPPCFKAPGWICRNRCTQWLELSNRVNDYMTPIEPNIILVSSGNGCKIKY